MPRSTDETGFVLPSVLAYIAVVLLIVVAGASALERARNITFDVLSRERVEQALNDLEVQTTYLFISSIPVQNGVLIRSQPSDPTMLLLGTVPTAEAADGRLGGANLWRADRGRLGFHRENITAIVEYQEVDGLISLNSSNQNLVSALLQKYGVQSEEADELAAALADYVDNDNLRRPLGGERADYRLRQLPVPTNSPLRGIEELSNVLGWAQLDFIRDPQFQLNVTFSLTGPEPRWIFSPDEVADLNSVTSSNTLGGRDLIAEAASASSVPSGMARFHLSALDHSTGLCVHRVVEMQRRVSAAAAPFYRTLVTEYTQIRCGSDRVFSLEFRPTGLLGHHDNKS